MLEGPLEGETTEDVGVAIKGVLFEAIDAYTCTAFDPPQYSVGLPVQTISEAPD